MQEPWKTVIDISQTTQNIFLIFLWLFLLCPQPLPATATTQQSVSFYVLALHFMWWDPNLSSDLQPVK